MLVVPIIEHLNKDTQITHKNLLGNKSLTHFSIVADYDILTMDTDAICLTRKEKQFRQLKNGNFNFRCKNKFCNASVIVNNSDQIIEQCKSLEHNHNEYTDRVISKKLLEVHYKERQKMICIPIQTN
ncbi:FLYWCH-type domain-containing protein [Aphis craccivora]|uniref:FLYWCH-type domain-containing protein n=1 Tax=Aphis craccivora TaxID=307492 RepID=A0A6G0ZID5_APHCR|nr:FLYWCH-type domain-containing protein [Aphis craccivora]